MKAVIFEKYGSPDVLQLIEMDKPIPKPGEVLVKVHAASGNPHDWRRMRGEPKLFVRPMEGFTKPKNPLMGADIAGTVEAVGSEVTQFHPGDMVFGMVVAGSFAEYTVVPEKSLTHKPDNVTFEQAASLTIAGVTALQGLRDHGQIQSGQSVLVNGASGGVGTFAVQIARHFGAEVTGVCSGRNREMVCAIGASHVVDYTQEDFTRTGHCYDLIFDAIGNRSVSAYARALNPNGRCVVAGFTTTLLLFHVMLMGKLASMTSSKTIFHMGSAEDKPEDFAALGQLIANGAIAPVIDRRYPLSETAEAMRYLETFRARGKVIINVVDQ